MSQSSLIAEMTELVDMLRGGELAVQDTERLEQLLLTSDEAVRIYVDLMHQQAALRLIIGPAMRSKPLVDGGGSEPGPPIGSMPNTTSFDSGQPGEVEAFGVEDGGRSSPSISPTQSFFVDSSTAVILGFKTVFGSPRRALPAAAAIVLMFSVLGSFAIWGPRRGSRVPVPIPLGSGGVISPFLATLSGASNCVWQGGVMPTYEGARLPAGILRLERGLAEIAFDDGARVLLEGPAAFEVTSTYSGFLHQGRLVARVESPSEGFIVQTPTMQVVDLGTEFGVDVIPSGATEVYCFEGLIEVHPSQGDNEAAVKQRLTAGQAGMISLAGAAQFTSPASPPLPFVRKLPKTSPAVSGGQVVNIDFNTQESQTFRDRGVYVGPGGDAASNVWNGVVLINSESEPLQAANGARTSVTVELSGANPHYTEFNLADHWLLDDYAVTANSTGRFVLRGLWPGQRYDLYLFGSTGVSNAVQHQIARGAAEGTLFSISGETKATRGLRRGDRFFTAGKDYVAFEGVVASAEGEIRGTWSPNPQANAPENNNPFAPFNGLQIVGPMIHATENQERNSKNETL
jgi:hypothetical protein